VRRVVPLLLVAAAIMAFGLGLPALEARLLYFPLRHHLAEPFQVGLAAEELQPVTADGVRLHGWWLRAPRGTSGAQPPGALNEPATAQNAQSPPVLISYLGNGGNVSGALDNARRLIDRLGVEIVAVDYRGYGLSQGAPSEGGLYADARAIYDAVRERGVPPGRIILFGRSLGAAVATDVALDRPCAGLALETPFLSVPEVARSLYPFIPPFLIRSRFDNARKLPRIEVPKLIVQAELDEVIPAAHAQRLYEIASPPKHLHVLDGSRPNDTFDEQRPAYFAAWRAFLDVAAS
jgi:uncharacterized protein